MPVLTNEDNRVLGTVTISDLVKLYDKEVEKIMKVRKDNDIMLPPSVDDSGSDSGSSSSDSDSNKNLNKS